MLPKQKKNIKISNPFCSVVRKRLINFKKNSIPTCPQEVEPTIRDRNKFFVNRIRGEDKVTRNNAEITILDRFWCDFINKYIA